MNRYYVGNQQIIFLIRSPPGAVQRDSADPQKFIFFMSIFLIDLGIVLGWNLAPFSAPFWLMFFVVCITFSSMDLFIDVSSISRWSFVSLFDVILMNFLFAHSPCEPVFCWRPYCGFTCFYTSERHTFSFISWSFPVPVLALLFDAFWHLFWLHFGIPFASNSMFVCDWFFDGLLDADFMDFGQKREPTSRQRPPPFSFFFRSRSAGDPLRSALARSECIRSFVCSLRAL